MDYALQYSLTSDDIEFLNETTIKYTIHNSDGIHGMFGETSDSGWCDYATGARVIVLTDRAVFLDVTKEELTFLTLKYAERLRPLHNGYDKRFKYPIEIK
jgi:hypothetical protein